MTAPNEKLFLHQEILLLALRDERGTIESGTMYQYAVGGAILSELLLANRIAVELNDGGRAEIEAGSVIIATGSSPIRPDVFPWDSPRVMTWQSQHRQAARLPSNLGITIRQAEEPQTPHRRRAVRPRHPSGR